MDAFTLFLLVFAIGVVAGLRSMTAPAAVSWAAHLNRVHLDATGLAFFGYTATAYILTALALAELAGDKLPSTPSRKAPGPFTVRVILGGLCGAALCLSVSEPVMAGAVIGALGGVAGTLGGYEARTRIVKSLQVRDAVIAVAEDLVAVGGAFLIVSRFV
ncbi:MAG: DUF4126 family protein [Acidobacteriota bacterium]